MLTWWNLFLSLSCNLYSYLLWMVQTTSKANLGIPQENAKDKKARRSLLHKLIMDVVYGFPTINKSIMKLRFYFAFVTNIYY